jgi:quercetin dioxygenase-like cupin family protein
MELYKLVENLADPANIPADGILSRTLYDDERVRAVLFGFAPGEELSEHTASMPAIIHILEGRARLTLGGEPREGAPGTWIHMSARLPHSVHAETPLIMLLLMLK